MRIGQQRSGGFGGGFDRHAQNVGKLVARLASRRGRGQREYQPGAERRRDMMLVADETVEAVGIAGDRRRQLHGHAVSLAQPGHRQGAGDGLLARAAYRLACEINTDDLQRVSCAGTAARNIRSSRRAAVRAGCEITSQGLAAKRCHHSSSASPAATNACRNSRIRRTRCQSPRALSTKAAVPARRPDRQSAQPEGRAVPVEPP